MPQRETTKEWTQHLFPVDDVTQQLKTIAPNPLSKFLATLGKSKQIPI